MDEDNTGAAGYFWMEGDSLAPPCAADMDVVNAIIQTASPYLDEKKLIIDLGCGDGRICTEACRQLACKALGCEIEEVLIEKFKKNVLKFNLEDRVSIVHGDLRAIDIQDASVIVLYLLPESILLIEDKLSDAVVNGAVLICNTWGPKSMEVKSRITCGASNNVTLLVYHRHD